MRKHILPLFLLCVVNVNAQDKDPRSIPIEDENQDFFDQLKYGDFELHGALRFNLIMRDNWGTNPGDPDLEFDLFRLQLDYENGDFFGEVQYRWQYFEDSSLFLHYLHHGWLGYRIDDHQTIKAGVHQVPFGILPYASNNFYFSPAFYVGLEDDYDLGIKYEYDKDGWNLQFAYYLEDEGSWYGESVDSARYSLDVVHTDGGSLNEEKHQFNLRVAHTMEHTNDLSTELGLSGQYGLIPNRGTGKNGDHYAAAVHLLANYHQWNLKCEAIRYEYNLENPSGISNDTVRLGAYDYSYNVASRANIYIAALAYEHEMNWKGIESLTPYIDYGLIDKDEAGWDSTQFLGLGCSIQSGRFTIYCDFYLSQNHPYLGDGNFSNGLAQGGSDPDQWARTFLINVGYYF